MTNMMNLGGLLRLARDTVSNPREGAETVLSFAPPREALLLMFALVIVVSSFLGEVVLLLSPEQPEGPLTGQSPLILGLLQAAFFYVMIHAIHSIGRFFGGTGAFEEAALLVIWLQFIILIVQVFQILAIIFAPPMIGFISIIAIALFFWLLVNFISVLHGFTSLGMVFVATLFSSFAILFLLSLVLAIISGGDVGTS